MPRGRALTIIMCAPRARPAVAISVARRVTFTILPASAITAVFFSAVSYHVRKKQCRADKT